MGKILISNNREATFTGPGFNDKASRHQSVISLISLQGVSVLMHLGLLLVIIFFQQYTVFDKKLPPALQVDLVSYSPKLEDILKHKPKQPEKPIAKKPDVIKKPKPKKKIIKEKVAPADITKEKPQEEKSLEPPQKKEVEEKPLEKEVEDPEQEKIKDLLDEIREKVAEEEMKDDYEEEEVAESGYKAWKDMTAQNIYNSILTTVIQKNWVFTDYLANLDKNNKNLTVLVMIKILANGDLGDIWIETKSGNDFLDKSAVRAIKKSAPFPPLPREFQRSSYEIGLQFSPKGLN